ncbi:MAG: nitrogenase iron-molybdenum cofactor biosynthesis protein NifE, partial [Deltaproteobacteria bacterium]|nr:nitrogenase iron-molybdenum cofactor biosynthesis protein NifE [Deltaproteobacteria bacterium]
MNLAELRELHKEPGCSHNEKKSDSSCPRPTPGRAAGGCSFDGAFITLVPIADAAHVVHGPIGCLGNTWNNRGSLSSGADLNRIAFTTDLTNNDVVFGGEKKLYKAVREVISKYDPAAVFVYQTCVTSMIGDDLEALCKAVSAKTGRAVIPVDSPGFTGTKNFGNRIAGDALLKHVIGTMEPATEHPYNVNLIGEFNIAGELWEMLPLFDRLGIRLICSLSGDARFHQIAMMHRAQVNMMVCSRALLNVARRMKEGYGIPFFEGSFYGSKNTAEAIISIAKLMGSPELVEKAERLCGEERKKIETELEALKKRLAGRRALLYTGGVKSWSIVGALQELGMTVIATGTKKSTEEDKERIKALMGHDGTIISEGSAPKLLEVYKEYTGDILLAGGRNQYTAIKARIPFVDVNQERHTPFTGFRGHVNLARAV